MLVTSKLLHYCKTLLIMNFKTLAVTSVLALGSIFGSVSSAEARPSDCWVNENGSTVLEHFNCDVTRYTSDGNWDWVGTYFHIDGIGRVFLQDDGWAKVITESGVTRHFTWKYDSDGDIRLFGKNGFEFSFRR